MPQANRSKVVFYAPRVFLNGAELFFDVALQMESNRVLVPMRTIFEALGAQVSWNEEKQQVIAQRGDTIIQITIGQAEMHVGSSSIPLDVPAKLADDRTLVPIRAVSEAFCAEVDWDDYAQSVVISFR